MKALLLLAASLISLGAQAQFPAKPVRLIVPYTPGGGTDIISRALLARIQQEIARTVKLPEFGERFASLGADAVASTPDEFAAFTRAEHDKFAKLVKAANIQPE